MFGKNIGQLGVVPKSENVVLPQSRVIGKFRLVVCRVGFAGFYWVADVLKE